MAAGTAFDYYYGDEREQFSFYRIPRQLITGDAFKRLSTDAKLLYGFLLDRMGLSAKNGWHDKLAVHISTIRLSTKSFICSSSASATSRPKT